MYFPQLFATNLCNFFLCTFTFYLFFINNRKHNALSNLEWIPDFENSQKENIGKNPIKYERNETLPIELSPEQAEVDCDIRHPNPSKKHYGINVDGSAVFNHRTKRCITISRHGYTIPSSTYTTDRVAISRKTTDLNRFSWECHNQEEISEGSVIDHDNGDRNNRYKWNLILSTHRLNARNRKILNSNNKSGMSGVSYSERSDKWISTYMVLGADGLIRKKFMPFTNKADAIAHRHAFNIIWGFKYRS